MFFLIFFALLTVKSTLVYRHVSLLPALLEPRSLRVAFEVWGQLNRAMPVWDLPIVPVAAPAAAVVAALPAVTGFIRKLKEVEPGLLTAHRAAMKLESRPKLGDLFKEVLSRKLVQQFPGLPEFERSLAGLMAWLGPDEGRSIPRRLFLRLRHHIVGRPGTFEWLHEYVVFYGCGWGRRVKNRDWYGQWPAALHELALHAEHALCGIRQRLTKTVNNFGIPSGVSLESGRPRDVDREDVWEEIRGDSAECAMKFVNSYPRNYKRKYEYEKFLSIHNWDPLRGPAFWFFQMGLQGDPSKSGHFKPQMFKKGLYFLCLQRHSQHGENVEAGDKAVYFCENCGHRREFDGTVSYADPKCPEKNCGHRSFFVKTLNALYVPGWYVERCFWACRSRESDPEGTSSGKLCHYIEPGTTGDGVGKGGTLYERVPPDIPPTNGAEADEAHLVAALKPSACPLHSADANFQLSERPSLLLVRADLAQAAELPPLQLERDHEKE
jgi:hypothetical protein